MCELLCETENGYLLGQSLGLTSVVWKELVNITSQILRTWERNDEIAILD
jgi:hypothetical protein